MSRLKTYKIAVIAGDGIGPEVIRQGKKVLDNAAKGFTIEWIDYPFSAEHYLRTGVLLKEEALEEMSKMHAIYLGAIGHPDVKPGVAEKGILLALRFRFDMYINLRPVELMENVPCPLKDKEPKDINFVVVRENTEDFYIGLGSRIKTSGDEIALQIGMATESKCRRIIDYAFRLALNRRKKLTLVDKANVLDQIYGLWREVFEREGRKYPDVERECNFVDACTQWMIRKPESYDVIVTPNMFGDIITDLGAAIQGGMGFACGANINPEGLSMFEPIHGSAPKYRGTNKANPIAAILAGELLLRHLGEEKSADAVKNAVRLALKKGRVRTYDMGGETGTEETGDIIASLVEERA